MIFLCFRDFIVQDHFCLRYQMLAQLNPFFKNLFGIHEEGFLSEVLPTVFNDDCFWPVLYTFGCEELRGSYVCNFHVWLWCCSLPACSVISFCSVFPIGVLVGFCGKYWVPHRSGDLFFVKKFYWILWFRMYWYCNFGQHSFWTVYRSWDFQETVDWWDTSKASPLTARRFRFFSFYFSYSSFAGKFFMQVSYIFYIDSRFSSSRRAFNPYSSFNAFTFKYRTRLALEISEKHWVSVASGFNQLWMFAQFLYW